MTFQEDYNSYGFSPAPQQSQTDLSAFSSDKKFIDFLKSLPIEISQNVKLQTLHFLFQQLSQRIASKEPFNIEFKDLDIKEDLKLPTIVAIIDYLKATLDQRLVLKVDYYPKADSMEPTEVFEPEDFFETHRTFSLTSSTVGSFFTEILNRDPSSTEEAYEDSSDWSPKNHAKIKSIELSFKPLKQQGAFYPYLNESEYDLSEYGIYKEFSIDNYKDNCFIGVLKSSKQFSEDEIQYARSLIRTRILRFCDLKHLCKEIGFNLFQTTIVDNPSATYEDEINMGFERTIRMFRYRGHYFIDHQRTFKTITGELIANNIIELIKRLHTTCELREMTLKQQAKILMKPYWNPEVILSLPLERYCHKKVMKEKDPKKEQTKFDFILANSSYNPLFQSRIRGAPLMSLYKELDFLFNVHLGWGINVNYVKYSELMIEIMFKTFCFDGVVECSYPLASKIKSQLVFPRPHTKDDKPYYSDKLLYYLDLNGAYMSVIDGIPMGIPEVDNYDPSKEPLNPNIAQLIKALYFERKHGNWSEPVKKALKQAMNSCWGYSISNPHEVSSHRPKDMDKYLSQHADFIVSYDDTHVREVNPVVTGFSYPQFARRVLYNYHKKMDHIKSLVNVLYENIDAILVTEEDYNKLLSKGLVGNELGQFKIEHKFSEIAIRGPRQIMAIEADDGSLYKRGPMTESFEDFKNNVIDMINKDSQTL